MKAKGFNSKGKKTWYDAGCGKSGKITVPWGNVAANKEMKVKGQPSCGGAEASPDSGRAHVRRPAVLTGQDRRGRGLSALTV